MPLSNHPFRSVLYIPGSRDRALEKAQNLPADAIIFDLEDAVAPAEKEAARETLRRSLSERDYGARYKIVRINGQETGWFTDDLRVFVESEADAILVPKVDGAADIAAISSDLGENQHVWAMMETPQGILNAAEIAAAPKMGGLVMGTNDLAKDLRATGRDAMRTSLQLCLLAARAAGVVCVDGVYNAFKDEEGLRAECEEGRGFGFDGKTLIHPAQLEVANAVFGPSDAELEMAGRQIAAYEEALAKGEAVAVVDGRIVENLHVETAKRLLAHAGAIEKLEGRG